MARLLSLRLHRRSRRGRPRRRRVVPPPRGRGRCAGHRAARRGRSPIRCVPGGIAPISTPPIGSIEW